MKCPFCLSGETKVIDSRRQREGLAVRRRRRCPACKRRFTTVEQFAPDMMAVKRNGARAPFDREKIRVAVTKACGKRPLPAPTMEEVLSRIEAAAIETRHQEIPTSDIADLVMRELLQLDQMAYIRYASVHRGFRDLQSLSAELRPLLTVRAVK